MKCWADWRSCKRFAQERIENTSMKLRPFLDRALRLNLLALTLVALAACSGGPRPKVSPPELTMAPEYPQPEPTGAIFQPQLGSIALFEDWRPRQVGDILTITLNEQVSASKSSSSNARRSSSSSFSPDLVPDDIDKLAEYGLGLSAETEFLGRGGAEASNRFTGTITVTVQEVLPNGNLLVSGEKQIAINQGTEYIRFSGVVNPRSIKVDNSVPSSKVASARIEYLGDGYIAEAQRMGWLQRIFLWIWPF